MIKENDSQYWCVIQTRSRFEKKCLDAITQKGISAYLPLQKKMKIWSDRMKEVEEPIFPGYLFVQFSENRRYDILNTHGVVRYVSFAGEYARVRNEQVMAIKHALSTEGNLQVLDTIIEPGQEVLITTGPFKDNYGRFIREKGKGKFLLTLDCIGKSVLLEIGSSKIETQKRQACA